MIRETRAGEEAAILALYPVIFPEEDLRALVSALIGRQDVISLAHFDGDAPVSHVLFTLGMKGQAALLGPLGVLPDRQQKGMGTALVKAGFDRLRGAGIRQAFVLGDPGYYGRFGFAEEAHIKTPCPIPAAWHSAWQSLVFEGCEALDTAVLDMPEPWMDPALWDG